MPKSFKNLDDRSCVPVNANCFFVSLFLCFFVYLFIVYCLWKTVVFSLFIVYSLLFMEGLKTDY